MDPAVTSGLLRVAVIGDDRFADLALPVKTPIRELIPSIKKVLVTGADDDVSIPDESAETRPYSLRPLAGTPFSLDATLEALGVQEGDELLLCQLPEGPPAPPVVEDIADAAAIHSKQQTKVFDPATMLSTAALSAALGSAALLTSLVLYGWFHDYTLWARTAMAVIALALVCATAWALRTGRPSMAGILGVAAVAPIALALFLALGGPATAPRLLLAAGGAFTWSLLLLSTTTSWVSLHTGVITVSAPVGLAAAAATLWDFPFQTLGSVLLAVALYIVVRAPMLAPVFAKFPFFYVPAPGEDVPEPLTLRQIEELPRRAALSQSFQAGMVGGSVVLTIIGSALVLWLPAAPSLLCWWLVVAVGTVTLLRLRLFGAAAPSLWFLASPLLTATTLAFTFLATGHLVASLWATAAVLGLTIALVIVTALKPEGMLIPQRGWLDYFENALLYTIVPTIFWLTGLISLIRNLEILS